jgi:sulfur carrier protein
MKVWVNGEEAEIAPGKGFDPILETLHIPDPRGVAIAVDGEVVPRGNWDQVELEEGQRVEIVRAVQGGSE